MIRAAAAERDGGDVGLAEVGPLDEQELGVILERLGLRIGNARRVEHDRARVEALALPAHSALEQPARLLVAHRACWQLRSLGEPYYLDVGSGLVHVGDV